MMVEELKLRIFGDPTLPTLIYLPGLHGDWTLNGRFRRGVCGRIRLIEFTYPRTLEWSLDDYAANIEELLAQHNISGGWLLGESFGSQIVWALIKRGKFPVQGIILAGGFVRHPFIWLVRLVHKTSGRLPFSLLVWAMYAFTKLVRLTCRHSPELLAEHEEFTARRTKLDYLAATHRLHLISLSDPRSVARDARLPVFHISGFIDPVVPWPLVRGWLRQNCPALRGTKLVFLADHNVLRDRSPKTAEQIVSWMKAPVFALPHPF